MATSNTDRKYGCARMRFIVLPVTAVAALAYLALFTGMPNSARYAMLGGAAGLPLPWAALRRGARQFALTRLASATTLPLAWWCSSILLCGWYLLIGCRPLRSF